MNTDAKLSTIKLNYRNNRYADRSALVRDIMFQLNCVATVANRHADRIMGVRTAIAYC